MAKILQIGMIPHNMPLFKFICALYQFHHQTPPIMKIDRGQIQFRDYVFTGTEPKHCKPHIPLRQLITIETVMLLKEVV